MSLRRFLEGPPAPPRPALACELCNEPLRAEHRHVVHLDSRRLLCACRACYLLFSLHGAGRYRSVPERYRKLFDMRLECWEQLEIPVGIAYFFHNSQLGRTVALYPGPAGATESLLSLEAWREVVAANPILAHLAPDVEALLVRRLECYLVPIDACYRLVGSLRRHWKGFDGGPEVQREIEGFFASLKERAL